MVNYYDRIKNLRESAGLTQAQLAHKLGVTRAAVNAWKWVFPHRPPHC